MPGSARRPALRGVEERNALVVQWLGLPGWTVKRMRLRRLTFEEAEAAGRDGLIRAAELWDATRGVKFCTYAVNWIKQAIWREEEFATLIHVPGYAQHGQPKRPARRDTPHKKRKRLLVSEAAARAMARMIRFRTGGETWDRLVAGPYGLPEPATPEPDDDGPDCDTLRRLGRALVVLSDNERHVIRGRFWAGQTLKAIGQELGICRERVRQIERDALARLREMLAAD
jgi:RNA polymerase nonessential primary-like sigma factor